VGRLKKIGVGAGAAIFLSRQALCFNVKAVFFEEKPAPPGGPHSDFSPRGNIYIAILWGFCHVLRP